MCRPSEDKCIFIIGGPAGSGKTTVARHVSQELGIPYLEGDDYHSTANKAKMSNGIPLTDSDRWDWLIALRDSAIKQVQKPGSVVVTCSALRCRYRDVLRIAAYHHPTVRVHFIYLKVDEESLRQRVTTRVGHYMKEGMVRSQMECLEEPARDEYDVIKIDVKRDQQSICTDALMKIRAKLEEHGKETEQ